jgi:hypothetical protein
LKINLKLNLSDFYLIIHTLDLGHAIRKGEGVKVINNGCTHIFFTFQRFYEEGKIN